MMGTPRRKRSDSDERLFEEAPEGGRGSQREEGSREYSRGRMSIEHNGEGVGTHMLRK